jgi:hypothetical protein
MLGITHETGSFNDCGVFAMAEAFFIIFKTQSGRHSPSDC